MTVIDKHELLRKLDHRDSVILELGCGPRKRVPAAIGIDALDYPSVDVVGDVFEVLERLADDSVDELHSYHFIEHIPDVLNLVKAMSRILKPGGTIVCVAPHFSNPYFYSDYTHKQFFGLYTFSYLAVDNIFKRRTPNYGNQIPLTLIDVKLVFRSPFKIRNKLKKIVQKLVNFSTYSKEFYEENLSQLLPCYEIRYRLVKEVDPKKSGSAIRWDRA